MIINCKIGTHSSTVLRVKSKRKLPEKGDIIKGIKYHEYLEMTYPQYYWKTFIVDDYFEDNGVRFYRIRVY